jgi:hypothetical protein
MPRVLAVSIILFITLFFTLVIVVPLGIFTIKQALVFLQNLPEFLNQLKSSLNFTIMVFRSVPF